jgi:hypothetical protein
MVLHLSVESAVPSTFQGDKGPVTMIQVVMTDKTKPAMFRTQTRFVFNLMPDGYRKYWQTLGIEEEPVTVLVKDLAGSGTMIKLKGEIIKGWATPEQINALAVTRAVLPPGSDSVSEPLVSQEAADRAAEEAKKRLATTEPTQKKAA